MSLPITNKTISVVLSTHNGGKFLSKQLDSLINQTRLPNEVIISDDASIDQTMEIVSKFEKTAPFPVLVNRNNPAKGFRENFLSSTKLSKGDWIAFCDQDDIWRRNKLQVCSQYMQVPGITQIVHQATLIDQNDKFIGYFDQGIKSTQIKEPFSYDLWGTFWGFSMIFDRRLLEIVDIDSRCVDYIDSTHLAAHDRWTFSLAQALGKTAEVAERLVDYRQHENNLFGSAARKGSEKKTKGLLKENSAYLDSTQRMREIIKGFPEDIVAKFPEFDRERALRIYSKAVAQLCGRQKIYCSTSAASAVMNCMLLLVRGGYFNAQKNSFRWRSFAKDISVSLRIRNPISAEN